MTTTNLRACSVPMAASGTSRPSYGGDPGTRTRANMPGVNTSFGICKYRPAADGARRAVDDIIDEIHVALVIEIASRRSA